MYSLFRYGQVTIENISFKDVIQSYTWKKFIE